PGWESRIISLSGTTRKFWIFHCLCNSKFKTQNSLIGLAIGAKVGPALADRNLSYDPAAVPAGFAFPKVDVEDFLVAPALAFPVQVIAQCRAPVFDGAVQHLPDGRIQPAALLRGQGLGQALGMQAADEQGLVCINITQS